MCDENHRSCLEDDHQTAFGPNFVWYEAFVVRICRTGWLRDGSGWLVKGAAIRQGESRGATVRVGRVETLRDGTVQPGSVALGTRHDLAALKGWQVTCSFFIAINHPSSIVQVRSGFDVQAFLSPILIRCSLPGTLGVGRS